MILKGIKVKKATYEPGDGTPLDSIGYAIGRTPTAPGSSLVMYFVIWEDFRYPVAIIDYKVHVLDEEVDIEISEEVAEYINSLLPSGMIELYEKKHFPEY